jgi:hypothetical protein
LNRRNNDRAVPAVTQNLNRLIDTYGIQLGIPKDISGLSRYFSEHTGVSQGTIRALLAGNVDRIQISTADRLAKAFRAVVPTIQAHWLSLEANDFAQLIQRPTSSVLKLELPGIRSNSDELRHWLCGSYIAYNFGFDAGPDTEVVRRVLHIWGSEEPYLQFRMSFFQFPRVAREFRGYVLPVGLALWFIGFDIDGAEYDHRGCSLFFSNDRDPALRGCKLGILSSTRLHGDRAPSATSIMLVRANWIERDTARFDDDITRISSADEIFSNDFGAERVAAIKSLMDDRDDPTSTLRMKASGHNPVLRASQYRFNSLMPAILAEVFNDNDVRAPFKDGWRSYR